MRERLPHLAPPIEVDLRLTIPAREALEKAGNHVTHVDGGYRVELIRPPKELVIVRVAGRYEVCVRLAEEPPYPNECEACWWERGAWLPCPECGFAILWCEAGYVPGWRICLSGHAVRLSESGKKAVWMPEHDTATLQSTR